MTDTHRCPTSPTTTKECAEADPDPQIPTCLGRLANQVSHLHELVDSLEIRLGTVSRDFDAPPETVQSGADRPGLVPVASKMADLEGSLYRANNRIMSVLGRLEL